MRYRTSSFENKSGQYRRDIVFSIKQKIEREGLGHLYYTDHELTAGWADAWFVSVRSKNVMFNATILSAASEAADILWNRSFNEVYDSLTEEEIIARRPSFEPAGAGFSRMVIPEINYPQFEGRTFIEQVYLVRDRLMLDIPPIREEFKRLKGYHHGVGLYMVIPEIIVDHDAVTRAIMKFRQGGENDWQGDEISITPEDILSTRKDALIKI